MLGMDSARYWNMTPAQIRAEMEGRAQAQENAAWLLGRYVREAVHAKRYPAQPEQLGEREEQTEDEMLARMMRAARRCEGGRDGAAGAEHRI